MENISQLVSDSLARHGVVPRLDHLRLDWSRWIRCESSLSFALAPAKPGIIALGEEMIPPASNLESWAPALNGDEGASPVGGKRSENDEQRVEQGFQPCINATVRKGALAPEVPKPAGKCMLALFQISETDDLGMALGRLFLPGNPLRERLASGRCFARHAVIEDAAQRSVAYSIFQRWMQESAETASGIQQEPCGSDIPVRANRQQPCSADILVRTQANKDVNPDSEVVQSMPPSISSAWGVGFMEVQNREAREAVRRPQPLPSGF
jgi:hypothetical protein